MNKHGMSLPAMGPLAQANTHVKNVKRTACEVKSRE